MKAVVTGGAGFIGSHLVEKLVDQKYNVTVLDNLSNGNLKNIRSVRKKIKFVNCDLSKPKNLVKYLKNTDYIFHLAGLIDVAESIKKPKKYYKVNVKGTINILKVLHNLKIKKFIYAASASCYGNPKELPTTEKAKIKTLSPYAYTKREAEKKIIKYAKLYGFSAISLRFFNVYGPRSKISGPYSSVINIFIKQKLNKKPLTVMGNGLQTRSFIYVSDIVSAIIKAANSKINNEIFNVGGKKSITIKKIADILGKEKKYIPKRAGDPLHSWADITKIRKKLFWKPKIDIEIGLRKLLKEW